MAARGPKSDKEWAAAVRKAVHDLRDDPDPDAVVKKTRAINLLAHNLVTVALAGDMQAMKEIGDRLDGKPSQAIEGSGEGGEFLLTVVREIIDHTKD
mgnify:CR=1 FL=1